MCIYVYVWEYTSGEKKPFLLIYLDSGKTHGSNKNNSFLFTEQIHIQKTKLFELTAINCVSDINLFAIIETHYQIAK